MAWLQRRPKKQAKLKLLTEPEQHTLLYVAAEQCSTQGLIKPQNALAKIIRLPAHISTTID